MLGGAGTLYVLLSTEKRDGGGLPLSLLSSPLAWTALWRERWCCTHAAALLAAAAAASSCCSA